MFCQFKKSKKRYLNMMMNSPTYSNLREEVTRGHLDVGKLMIEVVNVVKLVEAW